MSDRYSSRWDEDSYWDEEDDDDSRYAQRRQRRPRSRLGGFWSRLKRRGWYWPAPLGGVTAILLIGTIVLVLPVVLLVGYGRGVPGPARVAAAPPAPGQTGPGAPDPNFNQVPYPSQQSGFEDVYNPPAVAESPYVASPGAPGASGRPGVPGYGGGPTGPLPSPLPTPVPARRPGASTFVAVTGGGCPETSYASYFAAYLAGRPVFNLSGGWGEQGCSDRFWSVPMSGAADRDEPLTYVMWYFRTAPVNRGACGIWTYVPKGSDEKDSAGDPSFYQVLRSRDDRRVIGSFSIKQAPNRGTWAYGGTFNFDGGQIAIRLGNRGTGADGARHGAAQVLVNCAS
jgi:hypothetical protein